MIVKGFLQKVLNAIDRKVPEYGTIKIEIHQGQISLIEVNEKHKLKLLKTNN